jgi:acyl-CoA reductase-like NAD-dependent aldehyde dehydrogenase
MHATPVESRLTQPQALPGRAMNLINGKWVDAKQRSKSFDPATGEEIGTYADATREDVVTAIDAADRAFRLTDWKDNRRLRAKVLNQLADRFEARRDDLIRILSLKNGKIHFELVRRGPVEQSAELESRLGERQQAVRTRSEDRFRVSGSSLRLLIAFISKK